MIFGQNSALLNFEPGSSGLFDEVILRHRRPNQKGWIQATLQPLHSLRETAGFLNVTEQGDIFKYFSCFPARMNFKYYIAFMAALAVGIPFGVLSFLKQFNNYDYSIPLVHSRATGPFYDFRSKIEYALLDDGSEEITEVKGNKRSIYQNIDGNNTVDRIRIERYAVRDVLALEDILVRSTDFRGNEELFNEADAVLLRERENLGLKH